MTRMLTVWGRRTSSNVQALMWGIGELGLRYERHDAGHRYGGLDTPEFRAMNPNGTVPVLRDRQEEPLWETGAILRYLAGRYGSASFWPPEGTARAQVDKWAEWAKINVTMNFTVPIFWRVVRTAPANRDHATIAQAVENLNWFLDIAEVRLSRSAFLASDDLTMADIQFGHVLFRYFNIDIERKEHPALRRYFDALSARPAFREHVMVSYEELRIPG
jgi:glutathione S-transferase